MTTIKVIELLIALNRLIDLIIAEAAKRAKAKDLEKLAQAIESARLARSAEEKALAAKELRDAFG